MKTACFVATLVGVSSLVLTETPLPPVDFKGDFSGSLVDGWWSFLHHHLPALNHTQYNFTDILGKDRSSYLWYLLCRVSVPMILDN